MVDVEDVEDVDSLVCLQCQLKTETTTAVDEEDGDFTTFKEEEEDVKMFVKTFVKTFDVRQTKT